MNIDIVSNASSPPRSASPAIASPQTRQSDVQAKALKVANADKAQETKDGTVADPQEVRQAVEKISEFVSSLQSELSFSIDDASGSQIVKITDSQTNQVIRQVPTEEAVAIAKVLDKLQGLLIRDKA